MTITIKLALYDEDENGNLVELTMEELEGIRKYIWNQREACGFSIASVDITEE